MMMKKYELRLAKARNARQFIRKWGDEFFEVLDLTYEDIYQSVPFTDKMKRNLISSFKLVLNVRYATVILDKNDKIVGFGLALPSIGKALQKSGGRLTPTAIVKVLRAIKHPKVIDLGLVAIRPEYQNAGINAVILDGMLDILEKGKVKRCETNLNLESNTAVQAQWKYFDARQHKRRRSYIKQLEDSHA
jgi:ribosomal protein S18 acetylase RimI-like enzyme